jgi:hypothetical protein
VISRMSEGCLNFGSMKQNLDFRSNRMSEATDPRETPNVMSIDRGHSNKLSDRSNKASGWSGDDPMSSSGKKSDDTP